MAITQQHEAGQLERSLDYLKWHWSAGAVLQVFQENAQRHEKGKIPFKASADVWCINEALRQDIHQRACQAWCQLTGLDATWFPLSMDAVARLYFRFRKRLKIEVETFDEEIRQAIAEAQGGDPGQALFRWPGEE